MAGPAPGWYPDPSMVGTQRYWTGDTWSDHVAPAATSAAVRQENTAVDVIGLLCAVFIPIVGLIVGLTQVNRSSAAPWMIGISVVSFVGWYWVLTQ